MQEHRNSKPLYFEHASTTLVPQTVPYSYNTLDGCGMFLESLDRVSRERRCILENPPELEEAVIKYYRHLLRSGFDMSAP